MTPEKALKRWQKAEAIGCLDQLDNETREYITDQLIIRAYGMPMSEKLALRVGAMYPDLDPKFKAWLYSTIDELSK